MTLKDNAIIQYFKPYSIEELPTEYLDPDFELKRVRNEKKEIHGVAKYFFKILEVFDWYPAHYSWNEKVFLFKTDLCVLLFMAASFYTKYLDSANISTAYVTGMKEELNLHGNELNIFSSVYQAPYAVFCIILIFFVPNPKYTRYIMIGSELIWGICTFCASTVHNANQMYAVRFFIGLAESVHFPASYFVMSTWYTPDELFRRAGFYNSMAQVGYCTSGFIQSACQRGLDGVMGKSSWRWQFIIDGVITLGFTLYGFFFFPGTPYSSKKFGLLTQDEMTFSRKRLQNKVAAIPKKWSWKTIKEIFSTWQVYVATGLWVGHHLVWYEPSVKMYVKAFPEKYNIQERADIPAYVHAVSVGYAFIVPAISAVFDKIYIVTVVAILTYYANIILIIWNVSSKLLFSAFYLQGTFTSGLAPLFYAWVAVLCNDSPEKKAFVLALINALAYATNAWVTPLQWNTKDAPNYYVGYRANIACVSAALLFFILAYVLDKWDLKLIPKYAGNRHIGADGYFLHQSDSETSSIDEKHELVELSSSDDASAKDQVREAKVSSV
ncbi:hypothetical protein B5S28_g3835 [[Candida] boidinii]|uniref:Unnamed protein product n=1 Tax=Candida boidinii TaxID=5477 RepID=A0ACB5TM76_CANBO|nr:hypothetical protein B5S28_g3835 [[Candida] boidinii]OWB62513.1 hypothetical protein B5S29_g3445 [[Candida] boidinii]OWB74087.1 hypothetical protein B5S31_g3864 [[Candida] boidinii]OWB80558.1 hypothetical protein B5S32_g4844 [[Candida] boidinii]GME85798.1 unnamed protein product [[Candida] boidinii]